MNLLYSSDTHVYPGHLNRLLKAAARLRPRAMIVGGDIVPDWRGSIAASIESHQLWVKEKLLPNLERFRRECPDILVLLDLGNDDIAAARPLLEERDGKDLHLLHMRVVELSGKVAVAGYMKVNPTPFSIKDNEKLDCRDRDGLSDPGVNRIGFVTASGAEEPLELSLAEGTIEDDLDQLTSVLETARWSDHSFIFVSHAPPRDTALDRTGTGINVGSLAVRRFIETWGPRGRLIAALHGHIHESPWKSGRAWQWVADVPCFNVGQKREPMRALRFETDDVAGSAGLVEVDRSGDIAVREKDQWL